MRHRRGKQDKPNAERTLRQVFLGEDLRRGGAMAVAGGVALAVGLVGLQVSQSSEAAETAFETETVVVREVSSTEGATAVNAAQSALTLLDSEKLASYEGDEKTEAAAECYEGLQEIVDGALQDRYKVFEGVPSGLAEGYRQGKVPEWALSATASATTVEASDIAEAAEPVEVARSFSEEPDLVGAIEDLERSVAALPVKVQLQVVDPDHVDMSTAYDEELEEVLAEEEVEQVRLETDRRLSENLPDLSEAENGRLDPSLLCPIPWNSYYKVLCVSLPNLERLNAAFKEEFGHDLEIQSGYRTYDEQQMVHAASPSMTTLPGTSNHSWGVAVDFDIAGYRSYDHPEVVWLVENGPTYGWRNPKHESFETLNPEPWHFEFGTKYTDDDDWGFLGPIPEVLYEIKFPEGTHTETIYTEH